MLDSFYHMTQCLLDGLVHINMNWMIPFKKFSTVRAKPTASQDQMCCDKWALTQQNLSSGFLTKRFSNQSPQLQRLARKLKFHL